MINLDTDDGKEILSLEQLTKDKDKNVLSLFEEQEDYSEELMKLLFAYYKLSSLTNLSNKDEAQMLKILDLAMFDQQFNCLMSVVDALILDGKEFPNDRFNDDDSVLIVWFKEVIKIYSEHKEINMKEPLQSIKNVDYSILPLIVN